MYNDLVNFLVEFLQYWKHITIFFKKSSTCLPVALSLRFNGKNGGDRYLLVDNLFIKTDNIKRQTKIGLWIYLPRRVYIPRISGPRKTKLFHPNTSKAASHWNSNNVIRRARATPTPRLIAFAVPLPPLSVPLSIIFIDKTFFLYSRCKHISLINR